MERRDEARRLGVFSALLCATFGAAWPPAPELRAKSLAAKLKLSLALGFYIIPRAGLRSLTSHAELWREFRPRFEAAAGARRPRIAGRSI